MGCARYQVLLVDTHGEAKQKRDWTEKQILDGVSWLKRMNARGHHVLIRPSGQPGMTLFDGLTQADLGKLERTGVPVSAKIQVAVDQFQIWSYLGPAAGSEKLRKAIAKNLGLPPPNDAKFGALAGFVNRQIKANEAQGSFVLAYEPVKQDAETIARWCGMLQTAEKLIRAREKGISR